MRISDWSSDVCSSDLRDQFNDAVHARNRTHFVANLVTQTATLRVVGSPAVDEHRRRFLPPGVVIEKAAMSPALNPGSCSTAHSISCGHWFLPLMMIMSLARPTTSRLLPAS